MINKNRIVLVSQNAYDLEYIRSTLNLSELNAIIAAECSSGLQALSAAKKFKPALVIVTADLSDLSVEELAKKINPQNRGGAVICFTERADFELCRKFFDSGAVACVLKTDGENYLNERVKNGLRIIKGINESLAESALQAKRAVLDDFTSYDFTVSGGNRRKKLVSDALNLIYENYSQNISAKWVASKLFVSESYLMHELKAELNKTFVDCLREYRVLKAKELLAQGNMRVNEVAAAVGFSNPKYFIRVFKRETGQSPKEYKVLVATKG